MLKELLITLAQALVEHPDDVVVLRNEGEDGLVTYELHVAPSDMGKVIGKQGRIAKAIRSVMKAAAARENEKIQVDIVE